MAIFNHTAHKEMWNWLADNTSEGNLPEKKDWPGWEKHEHQMNNCFACEYDDIFGYGVCSLCPLVWPVLDDEDTGALSCMQSIYREWTRSRDVRKVQSLARQIANLPVKDGVECI